MWLKTFAVYGVAAAAAVLSLLSEARQRREAAREATDRRWRELNGANAKYMKQLRAKERSRPGAVSIAEPEGGELSAPTTTKKGRVSHASRRR